MPNDCWNNIMLKASQEQIATILTTEFTAVPTWAFKLNHAGQGALIFKLWSPWQPDKTFMSRLFDNYPNIWIKNTWSEEGGQAGIIVGSKETLEEFTYDEGCIEEWSNRLKTDANMPAPVLSDASSTIV
jgi:hypothetical protein